MSPVLGRASRGLLIGALLFTFLLGDARPAQTAAGDTIADRVLGQPDFTSNTQNNLALGGLSAKTLDVPTGVAVDPTTGRLYVVDDLNSRVLSWPSASGFGNGQAADLVLGQPDFKSSQPNQGGLASASTLSFPRAVAVDGGGNVYVADVGNNRVLMFAAPIRSAMAASRVFGQPDFTTSVGNYNGVSASSLDQPEGVAVTGVGGVVYVADTANSRVLQYAPPFQTAGTAATGVIGQPDFTSALSNNGGLSATSLDQPQGVAVDSAYHLYIADTVNNRALEYTSPVAVGPPASQVFGAPDFTHPRVGGTAATSLTQPEALAVSACGTLYVADTEASRVLEYLPPFTNGAPAVQVFGEPDFVDSGGGYPLGPQSLTIPGGVAVDAASNLYVADTNSQRVLGYDQPYPTCSQPWSGDPGHVVAAIRTRHTATLLDAGPNAGKVLVTGGFIEETVTLGVQTGIKYVPTNTAELYDPSTDTWSPAASMSGDRAGHAAILLPDHTVLVVGGGYSYAELYDPNTGAWTATGASTLDDELGDPVAPFDWFCRDCPPFASATLLGNGKVLLVGGEDENGVYGGGAELYDPAARAFTPINPSPRQHLYGTATLLATGLVLVAGGESVVEETGTRPPADVETEGSPTAAADLYDPSTGAWTMAAPMPGPLAKHTATMLADGRVLLAGGSDGVSHPTTTAFIYTPGSGSWTTAPPMLSPHAGHVAARLDNGKVLVAGNTSDEDLSKVAELYDPASNTWTAMPVAPPGRMLDTTITRLNNGRFLIPPPGYVPVAGLECVKAGDTYLEDSLSCLVCHVVSTDLVVDYGITFDPGSLPPSFGTAGRAAAGRPAPPGKSAAKGPRGTSLTLTNPVLITLYSLRDQVMAASPREAYYTFLYYHYSPELVQIVLAHADLFLGTQATLQEWQPALQSLVNGQGGSATISPQMESDLIGVLDQFKQYGSPGLQASIQQQEDALNLPSFVGLTMDQAQTQAVSRIAVSPIPTTYLPVVSR